MASRAQNSVQSRDELYCLIGLFKPDREWPHLPATILRQQSPSPLAATSCFGVADFARVRDTRYSCTFKRRNPPEKLVKPGGIFVAGYVRSNAAPHPDTLTTLMAPWRSAIHEKHDRMPHAPLRKGSQPARVQLVGRVRSGTRSHADRERMPKKCRVPLPSLTLFRRLLRRFLALRPEPFHAAMTFHITIAPPHSSFFLLPRAIARFRIGCLHLGLGSLRPIRSASTATRSPVPLYALSPR